MNYRSIARRVLNQLVAGIGFDASAIYLKCYVTKVSINAWKKIPEMKKAGYLYVSEEALGIMQADPEFGSIIDFAPDKDYAVIGRYHEANVTVISSYNAKGKMLRFVQPEDI